jgi:hypothetical protein
LAFLGASVGQPRNAGRRAALLGCLALAVGLAPAADAGHGHHRKPLVFVDGDSLAVGTRAYLPADLHGFNVRQSGSISRHAPEGVQVLRGLGKFPCVVVMSLAPTTTPARWARSAPRCGRRSTWPGPAAA